MDKIIVGTRGSKLALWQAEYVERMLTAANPNVHIERKIIKTEGDRDQKTSLTRIGGQGVFTKTIEEALLNGSIDIAVHSLKDLPSQMADGLALAAVPERAEVEDVLVTKDGSAFANLPEGATVATGSIRRRSQLLSLRPDIAITDLRGNIDTRLKKLYNENLDAIVMAKAALVRLGLTNVLYYTFSLDEMIPAVGQAAIGIQIRKDDKRIAHFVEILNDAQTLHAVTAERAFLRELDSGCQFPVGAYGSIRQNRLHLKGFVGSEDGRTILTDEMEADTADAEAMGRELAGRFIARGARKILNQQ